MDSCKQKKLATAVALCVLIFGFGVLLYGSRGIYHTWVDESLGPTYVEYDRTPLEVAGVWIICIMGVGLVTILIYFMISP